MRAEMLREKKVAKEEETNTMYHELDVYQKLYDCDADTTLP